MVLKYRQAEAHASACHCVQDCDILPSENQVYYQELA